MLYTIRLPAKEVIIISKLTCHIEKHKKGAVRTIERRYGLDGTQPESDCLLFSPPHETLVKSVFYRASQRENPERDLRRDAVLLCEVTVSGCESIFSSMEREEILHFFENAATFLKQRFFSENCMYALVLLDGLPRMQFGFVPMTNAGRISAKQVLSRSQLSELQADLPKYMNKCGYDIETQRGKLPSDISGDNAVIDALRESVRALERSKRELEAELQELRLLTQQKGLDPNFINLQRENQNLRLERIMLNRQLKSYVDVIASDPELEKQFSMQLQLIKCIEQVKKNNLSAIVIKQ